MRFRHTRAASVRRQHAASSFEPLEPRQLLATHVIADYFPLQAGATWNYSGTVNGQPATVNTAAAAGPRQNGFATVRLNSTLAIDSGSTITEARFYNHTPAGLRLFRDLTTDSGGTDAMRFGIGLRLLPAIVDDGAVISFNKNFNATSDEGVPWSGRFVGTTTVQGTEIIDTTAGSFEALRITIDGAVRRDGVDVGHIAETRWLIKGVGTARWDYAMQIEGDDIAEDLRINVGLTDTSMMGEALDFRILGRQVVIPYNDSTPGAPDGTNFAGMDLNGGTKTRIFKIENTSSSPITLAAGNQGLVTITGANASEFTVVRQPPSVIQPGQIARFSIRFDPAALGFRYARVSIATATDPQHPYAFDIRGTGILIGRIGITGGGANAPIASDSTTTSAQNGTRFGQVQETGDAFVERTFTITNSGVGELVFLSTPFVTISGPDASDFEIIQGPSRTVSPGASTTFTVRFNPSAIGARSATISIASNDRLTPLFTFAVVGTGTA